MHNHRLRSSNSISPLSVVIFLQVLIFLSHSSQASSSSNSKRRNDGFLSAASSWFQSSKNPFVADSTSPYLPISSNDINSVADHYSGGSDQYYLNQQQVEAEARRSIDRLDRYDHNDPYEYHSSKHHQAAANHEAEGKEISFVYPILLALLVLGALFVPFISLFFYLAVSAFNCQGIGGGFGQVTPVFGRRRRRRKRELQEANHYNNHHPMAATFWNGNFSFQLTTPAASATTPNDPMSIQVENPITDGSSYPRSIGKSKAASAAADAGSFIHRLPWLLLSDSIELAQASAPSKGSLLLNTSLSSGTGNGSGSGSSNRLEDFPFQDSQLLDEYMFWRRQLARNTIKLKEALGAWLELDSSHSL